MVSYNTVLHKVWHRADSRLVPSQWEMALLCKSISHWLGASLESCDSCNWRRWTMLWIHKDILYLTSTGWAMGCPLWVIIFGTACQIYCYGRYCVKQSVSPKVPESPSGPLVDNFIVLPCVACGVACVKLLPGVDRWNSLDDPRVIGPCHCDVWGWLRHQADFDWFFGRPILETSHRGASFRVTHTANRKC